MGRAPAVLAAALFGALVAYYETSTRWPNLSTWWDVAFISAVLMPAVFALVLLCLPLRRARGLLPVGLAFVALDVVLTVADANVFANFSRLALTTLIAFWFQTWFEEVSWVVLVAAVIPFVDALSVWRGPTKSLTSNHPHVFDVLSFSFPAPGEHAAAQLGLPDLLFFALFLAAAARFGLRVHATFVCMLAGLAATIAAVTASDALGLPALPGIAVGFLLPNADLLYRRLRRKSGLGEGPQVPVGGTPDDA